MYFSISDFLPYGPQIDVPASLVNSGGWTECFKRAYQDPLNSNTVTSIMDSHCVGSNIMLACRKENSETIKLLAWAPRSCVFTSTAGKIPTATTNCKGTEWYFAKDWSWGFASGGDAVKRNQCDVETGNQEKRLCFQTINRGVGFVCGDSGGYPKNYELLVFQRGNPIIRSQKIWYL